LIELDDVRKVYGSQGGEVVAVDGVSLRVEEGETVCLMGTSGSGKTTALKMVNRLLEPTSGRVLVGGRDVAERDVIRLRRSMGYVIQKGGLFPHLEVARNVGLLCELEGWSREDVRRRVGELLELVNLPPSEFAERFPHELSGGQQQRVGVARALALDPKIVLMDEPFGALDPITRGELHEEFVKLEEKVEKTILFVTHDLAEAFKLADRVALMDAGRLLQVGTEDDFRHRPASEFVAEFVKSHVGNDRNG
jgi:osmoprotectant transport system ATP-binding protein